MKLVENRDSCLSPPTCLPHSLSRVGVSVLAALGGHSPVLQEGKEVLAAQTCLVKESLRGKGAILLPRQWCCPQVLIIHYVFIWTNMVCHPTCSGQYDSFNTEELPRLSPPPDVAYACKALLLSTPSCPPLEVWYFEQAAQSCLGHLACGSLPSCILQGSSPKDCPGWVPMHPCLTLGSQKFSHPAHLRSSMLIPFKA